MTPLLAQGSRSDRGFERMYRRHVGDVYRYALAVMRNEPDAEDVTQTTFMNAYRAFARGERPEKAQNWLIAIAHNVCRQRFRQLARRPTEIAFDDDIGERLVGAEEEEAPSGEDIQRALGHLAFNQRAALVMRELEGRSYAEIAEILDLSTSAVETVLFRARRALREQLESSLTCGEAELAIFRQLDGRLPRKEKGALRAHLRECAECARFARRQRAQRTALRSLAAVPVPASLTSLFGGGTVGGVAVGGGALGGVALKAAVALTAGVVIGGAGYEGVHHALRSQPPSRRPVATTPQGRASAGGRVSAPGVRSHGAGAAPAAGSASARPAASRGHGLGRQKATHSVRGDASVAYRHNQANARPTHPQHPAAPTHPTHPSHPQHPASQPPGPYIGGPPPDRGRGPNPQGRQH